MRFADGERWPRSRRPRARYDLDKGVLVLTVRSRALGPRVVNDRIAIDATRIDVTLPGPT